MDALYLVQNGSSTLKRSASSSKQTKLKRKMPMLNQFHSCIQDFIENIVDVKAYDNCGYRVIVALLGMDEDSWSLVRNHLLKELGQWPNEYIYLLDGINKYEDLEQSLLVDGLSMVYKFFVTYSYINIFLIILIKIVTCR